MASIHSHPFKSSCGISYLTPKEIQAARPFEPIATEFQGLAVERARARMEVAKVWSDNQVLGRRYSIGCVALEITQRCNLDCTLCYLSEMSESTKDVPLEEIFRRISMIKQHFGAGNDVQITGGDPTLRKRSELMAIVREVCMQGLRPTLMTNGIAATRELLKELADNGLNDVAFHVDLTQERKGFKSEMELNSIRTQYIERARGLPLAIIFNTTVYKDNFREIPDLIKFFRRNTDVVGMASFQLQADTGRGELRKRDDVISLESTMEMIQNGAETTISFDSVRIGHPRCHRYGLTLEANGKLFDFFDDPKFFSLLAQKTVTLQLDRAHPSTVVWGILKWLFKTPEMLLPGFRFAVKKLWGMKKDIFLGRGKVHKLSFFIQNFMDASALDVDRVHACSFMVITPQGPISMCLHNAKRDDYILQPIKVKEGQGIWNPLTGKVEGPFAGQGENPRVELSA